MTLPYTLQAAYVGRVAGGASIGDNLPAVVPGRLQFVMDRRTVVGYVCQNCLARNRHADECRSPEWEWNGPNIDDGVPQEVMDWVNRHAREHGFWEG